ncbi:hypothetical protein [Paraburkholderia tuberum]|nr:hypothetical protein [Paraburkholderia tuberum]
MSDELKSCPFCGGAADTNLSMREPFILCKGCHTSSPLCPTLNDAKAAWNRRDAASAQATGQAMADGLARVPQNPTAEMVKAGGRARIDHFNRNGTTLTPKDANRVAEAIYRAMIDVAPAIPPQDAAQIRDADDSDLFTLLCEIRAACGDNGGRERDELVGFIGEVRRDAERYRAFFDSGLPICFCGVDYYDKASLDAAIAASAEKGDKA